MSRLPGTKFGISVRRRISTRNGVSLGNFQQLFLPLYPGRVACCRRNNNVQLNRNRRTRARARRDSLAKPTLTNDRALVRGTMKIFEKMRDYIIRR